MTARGKTAWERVELARHPARPHTLDYIAELIDDFVELHGDRHFADDPAIVGGVGRFRGRAVVALGHQKGSNTRDNLRRNFGMPRPEGYRKAARLLRLAERFQLPVLTFIDTPAADPGIGSEERGQALAIAENLAALAVLEVPIVCVVIGEGGSGGALALGVADRILMLENAIYAVASPEACASILWRDAARAPEAAETMRITAVDLQQLGIVDEIVPEPVAAHEDPAGTIERVGQALQRHLDELTGQWAGHGIQHIIEARYLKYRRIGVWREDALTTLGEETTGAPRP